MTRRKINAEVIPEPQIPDKPKRAYNRKPKKPAGIEGDFFDDWLYNGKRSFEAGLFTRENRSWATYDWSPSQELFNELDLLRIRARDLYRNSPIVGSYVNLIQNHVVGPKGFTFKSMVPNAKGQINTRYARIIEEAWKDFCSLGNFDVSGRYGLKDALDVMAESLAIDGEIVIRKRFGKGKYGFQIQILHAEQLITKQQYDLTGLDGKTSYLLGVATDEDNRPISYCLTNKDPRDGFVKYLFEEAEHVIHAYDPYMQGAPRGIPTITQSMNKIRMLEEYEKAELIAARITSAAFLKFKQDQPDSIDMDTNEWKKSVLKSGPKRHSIEPGQGLVLPPNVDASFVKAEHPTTAFEPFVRAIQKEIAAGLGISFNSLIGDFEHTSFSSMRAAYNMEKNTYAKMQILFIERVLTPIFNDWLDCACASGQLKLPPVMGDFDFYKQHYFSGVPYAFPDPLKEQEAITIAIANRTLSRTKVCEDNGYTYEGILDDLVNEQALENNKGITFAILPKNTELIAAPADIVGELLSQPQQAQDPMNGQKKPIAKVSKQTDDSDIEEQQDSDQF